MDNRSEVRFGADVVPGCSRSIAQGWGEDESPPEIQAARPLARSGRRASRTLAALACTALALLTAACGSAHPSAQLASGAGASAGPAQAAAAAEPSPSTTPFWDSAAATLSVIPGLPMRLLSNLGIGSAPVATPAPAPAAAPEAPQEVVSAVRSAGDATGLDPAFLMVVAWKESRFNPAASNPRSSADGLLQFTAGTWMNAVRDFGDRHGIGHLATQAPQARGRARRDILELRRDPRLSAVLAAEMIKREGIELEGEIGRPANLTDLYLTHRLGTAGAAKFLRALSRNPGAPSSTVVPDAGKSGRRTVSQTYAAYASEIEAQRSRFAAMLVGFEELAEAP